MKNTFILLFMTLLVFVTVSQQLDNGTVEDKFYPPNQIEYMGIPCTSFNQDWEKIFVMTNTEIKKI